MPWIKMVFYSRFVPENLSLVERRESHRTATTPSSIIAPQRVIQHLTIALVAHEK